MDEKEPFLSRWSRRKIEAKSETLEGVPQAVEMPAAIPAAPARTELAEAGKAQGATAEYKEFFDPQVDERLRRSALKRLFNEPQFNVMDGLDTYIDDYSKPDPIPEAMLRQLNQAKDLFLFDEETQAGDAASASGDIAPGAAAQTAASQNSLEGAADGATSGAVMPNPAADRDELERAASEANDVRNE